jgi:hypothetical protein
MSALARAILDELEPDDLEQLARALAPYLPARDGVAGWLDTKAAATHLGITVNALHKLTRERAIPFSQAGPGGKCYFRRSDLDAWRAR